MVAPAGTVRVRTTPRYGRLRKPRTHAASGRSPFGQRYVQRAWWSRASLYVSDCVSISGSEAVEGLLSSSSCNAHRPYVPVPAPASRQRRQSGGSASRPPSPNTKDPDSLHLAFRGPVQRPKTAIIPCVMCAPMEPAMNARPYASPAPQPSRWRPENRASASTLTSGMDLGVCSLVIWSCTRASDWARCRRPSVRLCRP